MQDILGLLNLLQQAKQSPGGSAGLLNLVAQHGLKGLAPRMGPGNADVKVNPHSDNPVYTGQAPAYPEDQDFDLPNIHPDDGIQYGAKVRKQPPSGMYVYDPNVSKLA